MKYKMERTVLGISLAPFALVLSGCPASTYVKTFNDTDARVEFVTDAGVVIERISPQDSEEVLYEPGSKCLRVEHRGNRYSFEKVELPSEYRHPRIFSTVTFGVFSLASDQGSFVIYPAEDERGEGIHLSHCGD